LLDREGAAGPTDVALAGDEKALDAALERLRGLGVNEFAGAIAALDADTARRAREYLASRDIERSRSLRQNTGRQRLPAEQEPHTVGRETDADGDQHQRRGVESEGHGRGAENGPPAEHLEQRNSKAAVHHRTP
jgi:hypothetical protein